MDRETMEQLGITQEMLDKTRREMERDAIYSLYQKFQELREVVGENEYIFLCLKTEDWGGVLDSPGRWWLDWDRSEKGLEQMDQEIARIKREGGE